MFTKSLLRKVAKDEMVSVTFLEKGLRNGTIVIPISKPNTHRRLCAIGRGLKIKVNANLGTSTDEADIKDELKKLSVAVSAGADTVMDLSTGGNLRKIRKKIIESSAVPVGTVPLYEAAQRAHSSSGDTAQMKVSDIMDILEEQAREGVDFFTVHAGITRNIVKRLRRRKRTGGIVSRGGALLAHWMLANKQENPFYTHFDTVMEIAKRYRITLSLGDALRPGAIADSTDEAQVGELIVLSKLVRRCLKKGVQVMVEGPGHIRLDEIQKNVKLERKLCKEVPFYILGPLTTDIACGYDHIVSAIGGALAAWHGASFLCVVTPAEHLRHPTTKDIKEGVIAAKIAAHSVDVLRFKDEWKRDLALSTHRAHRQWKEIFALALDEKKSKEYRASSKSSSQDICTMCGKFCSLKITASCNLLKR